MSTRLNHSLLKICLKILPGLMVANFAFAEQNRQMIVDIETEDFNIDSLDISHLGTGDSETVYTEDGRTIDILRTANDIEIFIDGEKLDIPSLHSEEHEFMTEYELLSGHDATGHDATGHEAAEHDATEREVLIIRKIEQTDETAETARLDASGNHEMIIIRDLSGHDEES